MDKKPKFKKGDWVIFPEYNKYPVKLDKNPKYGTTVQMINGRHFIEISEVVDKDRQSALGWFVSDTREPFNSYSWVDESCVRKAKKSDFNKVIKMLKEVLENQQRTLKFYEKIAKKQNEKSKTALIAKKRKCGGI